MTDALDIIRDEHRSMAAVVKGLQAHVAAVKDRREEFDYHLLVGMFDYIEAVPDRLHHPKEDQFLFHLVSQRSAEGAAVIDELRAQHTQAGRLLNDLRRALDACRDSGEMAAFSAVLDQYADFLWQHMRKEEDYVLPLAEKVLTPEDRKSLNEAFQANRHMAY